MEKFESVEDILHFLTHEAAWAPDTNVFLIYIKASETKKLFGCEMLPSQIFNIVVDSQRSAMIKIL